ncbi:MAG: HAD hydrolase family protein [Roseburia inulinivorans]
MKKIAFFDIDGTLTSEIDGSIPQSAITAIRKARANGNLMFLNTGRCIPERGATLSGSRL